MTADVRAPSKPRAEEEIRNSLLVAAAFVVLVGLGWLLSSSVESRTTTFTEPGGIVTADYPASWITKTASEQGILLEAYDAKALSTHNPTFRFTSIPVQQGQSLYDAATSQSMRRNRSLREYRELTSQEETLAGQPAIRVGYGFVADPAVGAGQSALMSVVRATDVLVLHGGNLLVFTTESEAGAVGRYQPAFDRILRSIRLK